MAVLFKSENHKYESQDPNDNIQWLGVTSMIKQFKEPFDPIAVSKKASVNPNSKWYGLDPAVIREHWEKETDRAILNGSYFHDQRESDTVSLQTLRRQGVDIPIIPPIYNGSIKLAPEQRLVDGIYPEHFVYLKSAGICGQADRVEVVNGVVDIVDFKTNKEIKTKSFTNWEGVSTKMLGPCSHLDDCNFNHYALQLSTYMYIILKHNPRYKPGTMTLHHIVFEKEGEDSFKFPIYKKNEKGEAIVKEVVPYTVPYLKDEVIAMFNWIRDNKDQVK